MAGVEKQIKKAVQGKGTGSKKGKKGGSTKQVEKTAKKLLK
jgi:hypothetical protein